MSMDKKVIPPASSSQEKARQYSTDKACIINNRRRSIYKQLSLDKKEALLLQRRTRYRQLSNKNFIGGSPTPLPNVQLQFTGQKGVAIRDIPPHPETGDTSHVDTSAIVSGSASLAYQQYDPKAITDKNNGGSGKTFLYRALLATVRSKGFIALVTTTSGVAASILPGGRTTHSRFKIPINIDEQFSCNISKQSSLASLIRDAKLIVWDEVSMSKKNMIEAFDLLMKDLTETNILFGGKVVVFGGDFRQTLPVVRSGKKEDFISESILNSRIWNQLEKLRLSENMRARTDPVFCEYLMRIGNGKEKTNINNKIEIPKQFIIPFTTEKESLDLLFKVIYPNLHTSFNDSSFMTSRVILTTKNDFVDELNDRLITQFPTVAKIFIATDETIEPNDQPQFEDFLHTLNLPGLPPYRLMLKQNCLVILLRNLNPSEGLCNGTRLVCCDFKTHVISCKIASGDFKDKHVFIPRIPLLSSEDEKIPIPFKRTQFPIRLCFAMTINKAQGQTLDYVGIYLREPVFSHGQLYVALSRAKTSNCIKILIRPPTTDNDDDQSTCNVVYNEIIQKALL